MNGRDKRRFGRRTKYPQIRAEPGQILELVDKDGVLMRKVIMTNLRVDSNSGFSVEFEDYAKHLQRIAARWPE